MEFTTIILDATEDLLPCLVGIAPEHVLTGGPPEFGGVPNGTRAGRPVVMIGFKVGGVAAISQITLVNLLNTADALKAKYGDPRTGSDDGALDLGTLP